MSFLRRMALPLCVTVAAIGLPGRAQTGSESEALSNRQETFGGAVAPAILPAGSVAFYGYVGLPELGAGFRQGFGLFEVEARARFNYLQVAIAGEALVKVRIFDGGRFSVAPMIGVGLTANSGARYFDTDNFTSFGVRPMAGAAASYLLADTLRAIALLEVPYDIVLAPVGGGGRLNPLVGGGLELFLGEDYSALLMGRVGLDLLFPPASTAVPRFGYEVRVGLGYRLF